MLRSALEQLRLEGAIFFRSEWTDAFAFESVPNTVAGALHPGADRLIVFHIVAQGSCWVAGDDGERHWAGPGDVIVIPYGDRHDIGGETPADRVSVLNLMDTPPWSELPVIRHGGGGERTDIVCGYLHSTDPLFDPAMRVFPSAFVVRVPPGPASGWIQASIAYALEGGPPTNASTSVIATRLPGAGAHRGAAVAPRDRAGRRSRMARRAARPGARARPRAVAPRTGTALDRRRARVGRGGVALAARRTLPPGARPLTDQVPHRMAHAPRRGAARDHRDRRRRVAHRVGYDSEEAFSRAFKRAHGLSPSHWRAARATPLAPREHA